MTTPDPDDAIITTRNTPAMNTGEEILEGEHEVSKAVYRLNREWRPKEPSAQRFKDNVVRLLENILNNTSGGSGGGDPGEPGGGGGNPGIEPDLFWDSGYFYILCDGTNGTVAELPHNMGQVPTRWSVFYSNVAKPVIGTHEIRMIAPHIGTDYNQDNVGFKLYVNKVGGDKNTMMFEALKDGLDGSGSWRIPPFTGGGKREGYVRVMFWR